MTPWNKWLLDLVRKRWESAERPTPQFLGDQLGIDPSEIERVAAKYGWKRAQIVAPAVPSSSQIRRRLV